MPVTAVLIVLLSMTLMFVYGVPTITARLADYTQSRTVEQAAATAQVLSETEGEQDFQRQVELSSETAGGEIVVVDTQGQIVAREGSVGDFEPSQEMLQTASTGSRMFEKVDELNVAVVPIVTEGTLTGGVVLASGEPENAAYQLFLSSGLEAAGIASILGVGLMLLLGALLSRRVERLAAGARSIEAGDLSYRIEPGFNDELGELASTFNAMAARLQGSFEELENRVTERTAELEAERARLEAVLRQMPSGVVIAEAPSGRILLSNKSAEQIRRWPLPPGVEFEEHKKYNDKLKGFHPDGRPYRPEEWPLARSIRAGEQVVGEEIDILRGDGAWGTVRASSSPIRDRDGRIVAGVAIFYDITEQKRAEEEIRRLNEELEQRVQERTGELEQERATLNSILDNLSEGVLAADSQGHMVFANPAARSMLGVSREKLPEEVPDHWREFSLSEAVAHCLRNQDCVEARVSSGETFLQVKLEPLPAFDGGGEVLVVIQDLSEGRRLEANQQRFLANAAHELKTPITTILGASELLLTEEEEDPETRQRFLTHIHSEACRMQQLSDTLLRLARTGWDLREPDLEVLDLKAAAWKVVERMQPLAEKEGLKLSLEGQGTRVRADAEWLEQALLVLVSNATKHSNRGGHIRLRVSGAAVAVEDEGAGISEADLPYVFERFYRGEDSSGGFGLGLPICKELVERMGGKISLDSREGIGTTVEIELPEVRDA